MLTPADIRKVNIQLALIHQIIKRDGVASFGRGIQEQAKAEIDKMFTSGLLIRDADGKIRANTPEPSNNDANP